MVDQSAVRAELLAIGESISIEEFFPTIVPEARAFALSDPFAFLVACCLDRGMKSEIVWTLPYDIDKALGHLDPGRIASMGVEDLAHSLGALPRKPRYVNAAPRTLHELAGLVAGEFCGEAARLWEGRSAAEVRETLLGIHGVGAGIANMTLLLIERVFRVRFDDVDRASLDIKPDVHAVRVLHRLGVSDAPETQSAIEGARRLNEDDPGAVDPALWIVGRKWCHAGTPDCGHCPLSGICDMQGVPAQVGESPVRSRPHG